NSPNKNPSSKDKAEFNQKNPITNKRHQKLASEKQPPTMIGRRGVPQNEWQKTTNKNHQTHY
ncbi:hypothetical protein, partial [Mycolicibacterium nivoides]